MNVGDKIYYESHYLSTTLYYILTLYTTANLSIENFLTKAPKTLIMLLLFCKSPTIKDQKYLINWRLLDQKVQQTINKLCFPKKKKKILIVIHLNPSLGP